MVEYHDPSVNVFEAVQQLISSPHPSNHAANVQSRHPFPGQYDFHLDFKDVDLAKDYKLFTGPNGKRVLFVNRDKPFVIRTLFRLPLTPTNLYIRVIPLFTSYSRRNEAVFRCSNHTCQSVVRSASVSVPTPVQLPYYGDASRSLICIQNPQARHCYLDGHLTILLHLDQRQMAMGLKPPSPCLHRKNRSSESGTSGRGDNAPHSTITSPHVHFRNSQSPPNGCTSSYPMGVVTEDLVCRLGCYNSCFGGQPRGGIEIIVRLEELPTDPRLPPIVHGLDSVEIHCSSTPARDIRNYVENINEATKKASANHHPHQRQSTSCAIESSSSSLVIDCRPGRRGLSTPSAIISDTTLSSASNRSKRRLALVGDNLDGKGAPKVKIDDDEDNGDVVISQSSTTSSQHLTSSSTVVPVTGTPAFIELLDSKGVKERYYLIVTKSGERAARYRFYDDASEAFDGSRMSSSRFAAYKAECLWAQNSIAQFFSASSENCQPPQ